jgi:hypothetical protein
MTITTREADTLYDSLVAELRERGLNWIVAQIEEQIAVGKLTTEKLPVTETEIYLPNDDLFDTPASRPQRRRSKATFVVSRPFTEHEKLSLLIHAIRIGIAELNSIAAEVTEFIDHDLEGAALEFQPEVESEEGFTIDRSISERAKSDSVRLLRLLDELEGEF